MSRSLLGAVALLAGVPGLAHGHFWAGSYPVPAVVASYPVYAVAPPVISSAYPVYAAPPSPVCAPVLAAPLTQTVPPPAAAPAYTPPTYAPPTAAPSSGSPSTVPPAPPVESSSSTLMTRAAKVSESSSFYDAYPVAARGDTRPAGDRCPVCFWNLTGHDVVLKVAGRTEVVPAGSRARLDLERRFSWQADAHAPRRADAPASADGLEIVLRR